MALIKSDTGVLNSRQIPGRYRSPELKADTGVLNCYYSRCINVDYRGIERVTLQ